MESKRATAADPSTLTHLTSSQPLSNGNLTSVPTDMEVGVGGPAPASPVGTMKSTELGGLQEHYVSTPPQSRKQAQVQPSQSSQAAAVAKSRSDAGQDVLTTPPLFPMTPVQQSPGWHLDEDLPPCVRDLLLQFYQRSLVPWSHGAAMRNSSLSSLSSAAAAASAGTSGSESSHAVADSTTQHPHPHQRDGLQSEDGTTRPFLMEATDSGSVEHAPFLDGHVSASAAQGTADFLELWQRLMQCDHQTNPNTRRTYAVEQRRFLTWCSTLRYPMAEEDRFRVTEEKLLAYLHIEVVGRPSKWRTRSSPVSRPMASVGMQTIRNAVAAIVHLWSRMENQDTSSHLSPRGSVVRLYLRYLQRKYASCPGFMKPGRRLSSESYLAASSDWNVDAQHESDEQEKEENEPEASAPVTMGLMSLPDLMMEEGARSAMSANPAVQQVVATLGAQMQFHRAQLEKIEVMLRDICSGRLKVPDQMPTFEDGSMHPMAMHPMPLHFETYQPPVIYKQSRSIKTVGDVWREWDQGLGLQMSVRELESRFQEEWRREPGESRLFRRRQKIIQRLEEMVRNGECETICEAIDQLEKLRNEKNLSLSGLQKWLASDVGPAE